jgi:Glycosyl transferase family 2
MPEPSGPLLTVVVIASRHREFLGDALDSVRDQKVDPREYELLVVADFEDPKLEVRIASLGGRIAHVPPGDIGPAIAAAMRESRGDVLVFLDDDDRFRPTKLASVRDAFRRFPDLGFYRNGYVPIDARGRTLPEHRLRAGERSNLARMGSTYLPGPHVVERIRALPSVGVDFNSSCMAVRRDLLRRFSDQLDLNGFRLLDALAFFSVLASDGGIFVEAEVLTEYRIHPSNASFRPEGTAGPLEGALAFSRIVAPSFEKLARAAAHTGNSDVALEGAGLLEVQRTYLDLRTPGCSRRTYREHWRALRRYRKASLVRNERRLPLALMLFSVAPGLGRRLYLRELSGRQVRPTGEANPQGATRAS